MLMCKFDYQLRVGRKVRQVFKIATSLIYLRLFLFELVAGAGIVRKSDHDGLQI